MEKGRFKRIVGMATVTIALAFVLIGSSNVVVFASDKIVLKATTVFPKNALWNMNVPLLVKMIEEDSGGRIKINWLGGPEVIKSFDQAEALRRGTIDMVLFNSFGYYKSIMPVSQAKGLSECYPWEERENGAYDLWDKLFQEKANAKYIGSMANTLPFYIYLNKKISKLEDLKKMSIRVMPLYVPMLKKLGANPVTIPPPEIYTALQRGVVDGFIWPVMISDFGWHEVTKYVVEPGIFQTEAGAFMNLDKWNKIPKDLQDVIINSMKVMEYIGEGNVLRAAQKELAKQKAAGIKKIILPPAEGDKLRRIAYEETWKEVIKNAPVYGPKFRELSSPCKK